MIKKITTDEEQRRHIIVVHNLVHMKNIIYCYRPGECMTGAGGLGGPRGIFLLVLNLGGSIGSDWASTILMIRCLAPLLNAAP